jgi:hypothetical protein
MDEENFFWSEPLNVDAIVANDGDEFLYNADADAQGDENFYGQNQSLAGDGGWWDDNYPGQTTDTAASPTQDAYGLSILNAAETQQLTRNINPAFINNLVDPNTPTAATATNGSRLRTDSSSRCGSSRCLAGSSSIYWWNPCCWSKCPRNRTTTRRNGWRSLTGGER